MNAHLHLWKLANWTLICRGLTVLLPFQFWFLYFFFLINMARTMLNKSGESGHLCLVFDPKGNPFCFSLLNVVLAVGLSYIAFIMFRYVFSSLIFLRVVSWMDAEFYQKIFWIYWDGHMIFIIQFITVAFTMIYLWI